MLIESSRMKHAISVWGPALQKGQTQCLQQMQNREVRISCDLHKHDHTSSHQGNLKWLSVEDSLYKV